MWEFGKKLRGKNLIHFLPNTGCIDEVLRWFPQPLRSDALEQVVTFPATSVPITIRILVF
jgi:hypothetical protein